MGKPYQSEIAALRKTISWALSVDIDPLTAFVREGLGMPLIATGSGGSLSVAKLATIFHQLVGAGISQSATPLQLASSRFLNRDAGLILFSAGGANSDILAVFKRLVLSEPRRLLAITGRLNTPLADLIRRYPSCECVELNIPSGKDGFLATNSLMAFSVVVARAYAATQGVRAELTVLKKLTSALDLWNKHLKFVERITETLWKRPHLVVLYSPDLEAAAVDIESKFTEAALGTVQIADYRHFAHGRHHWLAKRGDDCGVLALFTPRFQSLAESTLQCFPKRIPATSMSFPGDIFDAGVGALLTSIILAGLAGRERAIDPGRPGVPEFGRKIYHLSWRSAAVSEVAKYDCVQVGAYRKLLSTGQQGDREMDLPPAWVKAGQTFCRRLAQQHLKAIVLDFDGTLVFTNQRFRPISSKLSTALVKLLRENVVLGVASGRGKSLRETLQKAFPRELWSRVVVGYYNGAQTGLLSDETLPQRLPAEQDFSEFQQKMARTPGFLEQVKTESRDNQISLIPQGKTSIEELWRAVAEMLKLGCNTSLTVIRSGHSIDVIGPKTSKRAVITRVRELAEAEVNEVLCIGDKGRWPGNDAELLSAFPSLSVDEVSGDSETCWNLAPMGCTGPNALIAYLSAVNFQRRGFVFEPANIKPTRQ